MSKATIPKNGSLASVNSVVSIAKIVVMPVLPDTNLDNSANFASFTSSDVENGFIIIPHTLGTDLLDVTVLDNEREKIGVASFTTLTHVRLDVSRFSNLITGVWKVLIEKR